MRRTKYALREDLSQSAGRFLRLFDRSLEHLHKYDWSKLEQGFSSTQLKECLILLLKSFIAVAKTVLAVFKLTLQL
jgi:hypothetical protein